MSLIGLQSDTYVLANMFTYGTSKN